MKILRNKPAGDQASALVITLILCAILAGLLCSYFGLVQTQHFSVARSQSWNEALTVAEAGVEEGLALLNSGVQPPNFAVFPWTSSGGGVFKNDTNRPACKFGNSYYQASISNGFVGANPVLIAQGYVPGPIGSPTLSRTVCVVTQPRPTFPVKGPMIVEQTYNANGYNVGTDSFNSTNGPYNPANAGTNGDIVCLTTNANSIAIGNGKIQGTVRTPPGGIQGVTATVGSQGAVGDATFITAKNTGFETGHFQANFTAAEFPDATLPNVNTWLPPMGGTAPDGLNYNNLLPGGNYQVANLSGSVYVSAPNTVLYVTGNISISGSGSVKKGNAPPGIHIGPGASLTLYMGGASTSIGGNGVVNDTDKASAFAYYGLPSNTSISITGNGSFFGTIYAPEANFNLKGSGKTSIDDFTGASITKTTTMSGNFNFHYDESLIRLTTLGGYDPISWTEL
jgi:hypothetical protein